MEMYNDNKFIFITGLEESMLDVRERNINSVTFLRCKTDSILMDLKIPYSFLSNNVRSDNKVLQDFSLPFNGNEVLMMCILLIMILTSSCLFLI